MKKTLSTFFEEISNKSDSKTKIDSEIEMMSDETAQQLRGGDKDYTPIYEEKQRSRSKWFLPSILLEP